MSVSLNLPAILELLDDRSADFSKLKDLSKLDLSFVMTDGTGLDQFDRFYRARLSLAGAANNLDLVGGLTDAFGNSFSFAKLKFIAIKVNTLTVGYSVAVGGHANSVPIFADATDKIAIGPGGLFVWGNPSAAGVALTGGSSDILKLDPGANTIEVDIVLAGVKV